MRNSLPFVTRNYSIVDRATMRVALASLLFGGTAVAVAMVAVSPGTGKADSATTTAVSVESVALKAVPAKKLAKMTMPGARFRARDPLVVNAVNALGYLMRIESVDNPEYLRMRRLVSDAVAGRMNLDPDAMNRAWSRAPRDHQIALLAAVSQLGVPYVEGKEDLHVRVDCSGLLWLAWRTAGVDAPRVSTAQLDPRMRIDRRDALAGDIAGEGKHVHMYLGLPKAFIHAPHSGRLVRLKIMKDAQWNRVAWTNPSNIATYRL